MLRGLRERSLKIQTADTRLSHILELTEGLPKSVASEITNCQTEGLKVFTTAARSVGAKVHAVLSELDRIA